MGSSSLIVQIFSLSVGLTFGEFHGFMQPSTHPRCHQHFELPVQSPDTAGAFLKILPRWSVNNYSLHLSRSPTHPLLVLRPHRCMSYLMRRSASACGCLIASLTSLGLQSGFVNTIRPSALHSASRSLSESEMHKNT